MKTLYMERLRASSSTWEAEVMMWLLKVSNMTVEVHNKSSLGNSSLVQQIYTSLYLLSQRILKFVFMCCSEPLAYEAGGPSVSGGEMPAERQRDSPSTPTDTTPHRPSTSNFLKSDGTLDYDGECSS